MGQSTVTAFRAVHATCIFGVLVAPLPCYVLATDGPTGTVQQPIIAGATVSTDTQKALGLVTVGNRCSGTLVNQYWVLTADHCVANNGSPNGPLDTLANLSVNAAWATSGVIPTAVVRYTDGSTGYSNIDVALLFLGDGDFGAAPIQLFYVPQVDTGRSFVSYGRGIYAYATGSGPTAVPTKSDGAYRSATLSVTSVATNSYSFAPNQFGQIVAGGDSGGPDIVISPDNVHLGIAGVHSTCRWTSVANAPTSTNPWTWVNNIPNCTSAALVSVRDDIVRRIQQLPGQFVGQFSNVAWSQNILYAVQTNGQLLWYRNLIGSAPSSSTAPNRRMTALATRLDQQNWVFEWQDAKAVGTGWTGFKSVIPGGQSELYALAADGVLRWYRHDGSVDGTFRWSGPITVGTGWSAFKDIVGMGEGVLYGIGNDGSLSWYRHTSAPAARPPAQMIPRWWTGPTVVGTGWQAFAHVFATGQGVMYAITPDGRLLWYRYNGYLTGTSDWSGPAQVGSGWQKFTRVFSTGAGNIFAIDGSGSLYWYHHDGYLDGSSRWQKPLTLGFQWNSFVSVFPSLISGATQPVIH